MIDIPIALVNEMTINLGLPKKKEKVTWSEQYVSKIYRDCCAKFATGLCIILKGAFLFKFLTKFDHKHFK